MVSTLPLLCCTHTIELQVSDYTSLLYWAIRITGCAVDTYRVLCALCSPYVVITLTFVLRILILDVVVVCDHTHICL
jgi:hypothetical protein